MGVPKSLGVEGMMNNRLTGGVWLIDMVCLR